MTSISTIIVFIDVNISISILSDWIDMYSLSNFDIALCNHSLRSQYKKILKNEKGLVVEGLDTNKKIISEPSLNYYYYYLRWLFDRQIKCSSIGLFLYYEQQQRQQQLDGHSIKEEDFISNINYENIKNLHLFDNSNEIHRYDNLYYNSNNVNIIINNKSQLQKVLYNCRNSIENLNVSEICFSPSSYSDYNNFNRISSIFDNNIIFDKLSSIDLSGCNIRDSELSIICQSCWKLKIINISNCFHITDVGIVEVCCYCNDLISISVNRCIKLTDQSIKSIIVKYSKQLEYINIKKCSLISG